MSVHEPLPSAALLVIDLQTGMFDGRAEAPIHDADNLVSRVKAAIGWARQSNRPIAFIRHDGPPGDPLARGQPGFPVWPGLGQAANEPTFDKAVGDAFSNPALGQWLSAQGAGEVILTGAQTDHCVAATLKGAQKAGLEVTVISDGHSTWDFGGETAEQIIQRYNTDFEQHGAKLIRASLLEEAPR